MGQPTNSDRGLPPTLDDPAFLEWARRNGTPVGRTTPTSQLLPLWEKYTYQLRDAARAKLTEKRKSEREKIKKKRKETLRVFSATKRASDDSKLAESIAKSFSYTDSFLDEDAKRATREMIPLRKRLSGQHWESSKKRWAYIRYYIQYWFAEWDTPLTQDDLLQKVIENEQDYLKREEEQRASDEWRAEPGQQREALQAWASQRAMNLVDDFDRGVAYFGVDVAGRESMWIDTDIVGFDDSSKGVVAISYKNGNNLKLPTSIIDFDGKYESKVRDLIVRRHKSTGRLVPCAIFDDDVDLYAGMPEIDRVSADDRVLTALPWIVQSFAPTILHHYSDEAAQMDMLFGVAKIAQMWTLAKGLPLGARGGAAGATFTAGVLGRGVALGRSALAEADFAFQTYGFTTQAGAYLSNSLYTFYLSNAVAINTTAVVGAELTFSLYGQDVGPMSNGDTLTMAIQEEKAGAKAMQQEWKAVSVEIESIDKTTGIVKARPIAVDPISEEVAKNEFNLGKNVLSDGAGKDAQVARGVDDASTTGRLSSADRGAADDAKAARGLADDGKTVAKGKGKIKLAPDPRPQLKTGEFEAGMRSFQSKIKKLSAKYDPKALDKIANISADTLRDAQIHPKDLEGLANSLSRAGKDTQKFVNRFHDTPGFENVILNWAKRRYYNAAKGTWQETRAFYRGTAFFMKYANAKLDPALVRFEWPASINDTKWGEEIFARYVDVVVDAGNEARPGQRMYIELKSWTEGVLASKAKNPRGVVYQLTRDTALFSPDNIRWVFDGSKVSQKSVLAAFEEVILKDDYLSTQWGGKDSLDAIRENLKKVIEVF